MSLRKAKKRETWSNQFSDLESKIKNVANRARTEIPAVRQSAQALAAEITGHQYAEASDLEDLQSLTALEQAEMSAVLDAIVTEQFVADWLTAKGYTVTAP